MTVYVIDASVASRFLLVEDLSDRAGMVLQGFLEGEFNLSAPKLVTYEVGNTLWKAVRQTIIGLDEAQRKLSYLLRLRIDTVELDERDHKEALNWGVKNSSTYYDSVYVKTAIKAGAVLLTCDDVLYQKAHKEVPTMHLKDYSR